MAAPAPRPDGVTALGLHRLEVRALAAERPPQLRQDDVVREEPLELRVGGEPVAVIMRTPGDDERLALGYLFTEGIFPSAGDLPALRRPPGEAPSGDVLDAIAGAGARVDLERLDQRGARFTGSAGGIRGRVALDDLVAGLVPMVGGPTVPASRVHAAVDGLGRRQPLFALTGGSHGAAAHAADGTLLAACEDVGRHNAVDKVVGALLLAGRVGGARGAALLAVSGRAGREIVQKAARTRIPVVASVSAPTSAAVELARRCGVTLAGFVRPGRMNLYVHAERVQPD